jgi:GGDEF domain-containing protein
MGVMALSTALDARFEHILDAISDGLMAYGQRLVAMVRDSRFGPAQGAGIRLTVSAGGALVASGDTDERMALERADAAMYRAKRSGRDNVVVDASD